MTSATHTTADIHQGKVFEAHIVASIDRLNQGRSALFIAPITGQIDVATYAKSGTPDGRLDAIQEEMVA
ncbi:hypothetical protein [Yoonia sp. MH D7]